METITLKPFCLNQTRFIALHFDNNNASVLEYVKAFPEIYWSESLNTFYTAHHKNSINELFTYFRKRGWYVDYEAFKTPAPETGTPNIKNSISIAKLPPLSDEGKIQLEHFKKWLEQKRFSSNTVKTYVEVVALFLRYLDLKHIKDITARRVEQFNYDFFIMEENLFLTKTNVSVA